MFRALIYPSSGVCDYVVEIPYWPFRSWFVVCWSEGAVRLGWYPGCRFQVGYNYQQNLLLLHLVGCLYYHTELINNYEAISIKYYTRIHTRACVFLLQLSGIQTASFLCSIILSRAACLDVTYYSTLPHKEQDVREKIVEHKYVFRFSPQLLSETYFTLLRLQRDTVINLHSSP